jgi:hypothetical protein
LRGAYAARGEAAAPWQSAATARAVLPLAPHDARRIAESDDLARKELESLASVQPVALLARQLRIRGTSCRFSISVSASVASSGPDRARHFGLVVDDKQATREALDAAGV